MALENFKTWNETELRELLIYHFGQDALNVTIRSCAKTIVNRIQADYARAMDDPSKSPLGEVRRGPSGDRFVKVSHNADPPHDAYRLWVCLEKQTYCANDAVQGWEIIDQVVD